jgi:type I restriction enzyme M protein
MVTHNMTIKEKTLHLIDDLKATCAAYGMGNDGNEYKIITQVFLYKFLNDKFGYEIKNARSEIAKKIKTADKWETAYAELSDNERMLLQSAISPDVPMLEPYHLISNLWNQQGKGDFDTIFDNTMTDIAEQNADIFSTQTTDNTKIPLFEPLTNFVTDSAQRAPFARALVDKLVNFSFEEAFVEHYDFFASIFEYLIKDYNTAGGGKYAEYYTPHAVATIMARLLVDDDEVLKSVTGCDPTAGTGTLVIALAHQIGTDRCTIYTQDQSQKSTTMLRLNLILNNLVHSLPNVIQGDSLTNWGHLKDGEMKEMFDYVVSNPPFNVDFSEIVTNNAFLNTERFFAGIPNVPNKSKDSMAIYLCFLQHILYILKKNGRAAVVVPTGFLTASSGIAQKIKQRIIDNGWLRGVVSMPSNIFANTGTNVSVIFIDKGNTSGKAILIDASKLGEKIKIDKNQKTVLRDFEIEQIVSTFKKKEEVDDFSKVVSFEDIKQKKYSLSAGQYFDIKIEYVDITENEFNNRMAQHQENLQKMFEDSHALENDIMEQLKKLKFNA